MKSLIKLLALSGIVYVIGRAGRRPSEKTVVPREPLVIDSEVFVGAAEIPDSLARVLEELSAEQGKAIR